MASIRYRLRSRHNTVAIAAIEAILLGGNMLRNLLGKYVLGKSILLLWALSFAGCGGTPEPPMEFSQQATDDAGEGAEEELGDPAPPGKHN